jgi:hypothetical protein
VQVLDHEQNGLDPRFAEPEPLDRLQRALAALRRIQRLPGTVVYRHVQQSQERRQARLKSPVERQEPGRHLLANLWRVVAVLDVEVGPEEVDHGQIRGRLAIRDRGAVADEPAVVAMRPHDLPDQPRLTDARLPDNGHDLTVAGGGPGQRVAQLLQLGTPPDQASHRAARCQPRALNPFEPIARPTPRVDGADGHELEPPLQCRRGGGAHQDRVRLGGHHQALERRIRLALGLGVDHGGFPRRAHEALSRMDRDPHVDAGGGGGPGALAYPPDRHGSVGRPPRSILDRLEPEDPDHPHRAELLDASPEALHLLDEDLEGPGDVGYEVASRRKH